MSQDRKIGQFFGEKKDQPPLWFWLLPALVGFIRTLPFIFIKLSPPPAGQMYLGVGYLPKDFFAYLGFARQAMDHGSFFLVDPFTTELQSPRFILLFHWFVGLIGSVVGNLDFVLELIRIPLLFLFFWVLWKFLIPILPERKERLVACVLVAFSGGLEFFLRPILVLLPAIATKLYHNNAGELFGWNTFTASFNPLWILGLTGALFTLGPIFRPAGLRGKSDVLRVSAGFLLTYFTHPYSAIGILSVAFFQALVEGVFQTQKAFKKQARIFLAFLWPLIIIALVGFWQSKDHVFAVMSGFMLGAHGISIVWYPLTLGILGVASLIGGRFWFSQRREYRYALLSWVIAVMLLSNTDALSGYKFVFLLHLPLCIFAAPFIWSAFQFLLSRGREGLALVAVVMVLLFGQVVILPYYSIRDALTENVAPDTYSRILSAFAHKPTGNVLSPRLLGYLIPAFTTDRVWIGHYYLTPDFFDRIQVYNKITSQAELFGELEKLIADQNIRYLVIPHKDADRIVQSLGNKVVENKIYDDFVLVTLEKPSK